MDANGRDGVVTDFLFSEDESRIDQDGQIIPDSSDEVPDSLEYILQVKPHTPDLNIKPSYPAEQGKLCYWRIRHQSLIGDGVSLYSFQGFS